MSKNLVLAIARIAIFITFGLLLGLSVPAQADSTEGENIPDAVTIDEGNETFILYPELLPACDDEDGTTYSDGVAQDACYWDSKGTGYSFISLSR